MPTKNKFFFSSKLVSILFTIVIINQFSMILFISYSTLEIKVFLNVFFVLTKGSGSVKIITIPDPGGLKTYRS
jgi:hypothetical protein